jgi:hypothetical protein
MVTRSITKQPQHTYTHTTHTQHTSSITMTAAEEHAARPKTSGRSATPKELEGWARKKSPLKASPPKPAAAAEPAPEEPVFAMRKGLPEDSPKAMARFVSSDRGVTGACAASLTTYAAHTHTHTTTVTKRCFP